MISGVSASDVYRRLPASVTMPFAMYAAPMLFRRRFQAAADTAIALALYRSYEEYENFNIFGEGTAEYRLSFDGDASGLFSSLDTLPDINGNDAVRKAAAMDGIYLPEPEDGTPFAYTSKNNELNWVLLLYYSEENTAYMITCDA